MPKLLTGDNIGFRVSGFRVQSVGSKLLKGCHIAYHVGITIGVMKGDTGRLDHSSYALVSPNLRISQSMGPRP